MSLRRLLLLALAVAVVPGCNCGPNRLTGTSDAGAHDAGGVDAGVADAGSPDSGALDSGLFDAGALDAGSPDAGLADSGTPDAGPADAGSPDSGTFDGGLFCATQLVQTLVTPSSNVQFFRVAWDGQRYAGAWANYPSSLEFAFLGPDGTEDPSSVITVSPSGTPQFYPRVASGASGYGVVMADDRFGVSARAVFFNLISPAEAVLYDAGLQLNSSGSFAQNAGVVYDPTQEAWAVAWTEGESAPGTTYFEQLTAAGAPIATSKVTVGTFSIDETGTPMVWNGNGYALSAVDGNGAAALVLLSKSGQVTKTVSFTPAAQVMRTAVAWSGSEYAVVWMSSLNGVYQVYAGLADASGNLLKDGAVIGGTGTGYAGEPDVAWDGTNFRVVFDDGSNTILTSTLDPAGNALSTNVALASGGDAWPDAVTNGCQLAVPYVANAFGSGAQAAMLLLP